MMMLLCIKQHLRLRQFLANESPLKMIKNAFYFTSKALFVLKIFKFLSWLFGHVAKRLDKKDQVNLKLASQPGEQTIAIHILPNISRSKGNQTIKFGQLIECKMRNIFPEKSYTKCDGETSPGLFSEKLKLSKSVDQQSKVLYSFFCMPNWGLLKHLKLSSRPLSFTSY